MSNAYDSFEFEHKGRKFIAELHTDDDSTPPWKRADGHGTVTDWTTRDKQPGERVLSDDGHSKRYYDWAGTMRKARAEFWGAPQEWQDEFVRKHGRTFTRGEETAAAVESDFEFLRGWCNAKWHYCGVSVRALDAHGQPVGDEFINAIWGIEFDADDYIKQVARELAEQVPSEAQHYADEMKALAKRMHDAADVNSDATPGLRDAADNLQQMAADFLAVAQGE